MQRKPFSTLGCALVLAGAAAPGAFAADNYFLPDGINDWSVSAYWSLLHCPLPNENVYIEADDFVKVVTYDWNQVSDFNYVRVDGNGGWYGQVFQPAWTMATNDMDIAVNGVAYYVVNGPGFVWVDDDLMIGAQGTDPGHFEMETASNWSAGLYVGDHCYVGDYAPGDFDHRTGYAEIRFLHVGAHDEGEYHLHGLTQTTSILRSVGQVVVGNGSVGTFEQTGGHLDQTDGSGLILGLNPGGDGTYNMRGGLAEFHVIAAGLIGDGTFNLTGGTVEVAGNVSLGVGGDNPNRTMFIVSDDDDEPTLTIGGDLKIGIHDLAGYEQVGSGTVTVDGTLEVWQGTTDPFGTSYLHMGPGADWLGAAEVINHSGHIDLNGGTLNTPVFRNDSSIGVNIDEDTDARILNLTSNDGSILLWRNATLRGPHAGGGVYFLCNFTNNANFEMGTAGLNGGTFQGTLTNNDTFEYFQGDFSESSLLNYGTVILHSDFACTRIINDALLEVPADQTIDASGAGWSYGMRNFGDFVMEARSEVTLGADKPLINDGNMYAGATGTDRAVITGDLVNRGYLLPSDSALPAGELLVTGEYETQAGAELRIRMSGTSLTECDRLVVQGTAYLAGRLDVRLDEGFVPEVGDDFIVMQYGARSGMFNPVLTPALPPDRAWDLDYDPTGVSLHVVATAPCPEDLDNDGIVGFPDLLIVLANWGGNPATDPGDVDGDGNIGFSDILAILSAWGSCT